MTKQVNSLSTSRLVNMERQCWADAQYSRQGMSRHNRHSQRSRSRCSGEKVVNMFKMLGCIIHSNCTEACHRVSKKSATLIVKF